MTKVQIFTTKEHLNSVVTELLKFGNFEPKEPDYPISSVRLEEYRRKLGEIQEHINKIKIIMELAGILLEPQGKMKVKDWSTTSEEVSKEAEKVENKYRDLLEEIGKIRAEIELYRAQLKELEPFKNITVELSKLYNLNETRKLSVYLFLANSSQLEKIKELKAFTATKKVEENKYAVILIALKDEISRETLERDVGVKIFETPDGKAPYDVYNEISSRIQNLEKILEETRGKMRKELKEQENELKEVYGKLLTVRDALSILSKARVSNFYIQIEGYVPEKYSKKIQDKLENYATLIYAYPQRYEEKESPPTLVSIPNKLKAVESIVEIYGTPSYWEISPIIFLIFSFPFIFGLMFPDFGNALVLFIFAIWFYKYGLRKGSENIKNLSLVLIYSSAVAMVTGLLAREFFGPLLVGGPREVFNDESYPVGPLYYVWPIPLSVSESIKYIIPFGNYAILSITIQNTIIISVLIGAISLFVSSLLGVINAIRKKDPEFLFFEKLPLLILYTVPLVVFGYGVTDPSNYFGQVVSLLGAISNAIFSFPPNLSTPANVLGYVLVLWVELGLIYNWISKVILVRRHEKASIGQALGLGFIEGAFEAGILLLSNTISFLRILVFALAHYYLLYAFSYMGLLVLYSETIPFAVAALVAGIILTIGNLLAIALEGLVVFIQDMRLHFYEMFSKFYEGAGRKFEPAMNYVQIIEEKAIEEKPILVTRV